MHQDFEGGIKQVDQLVAHDGGRRVNGRLAGGRDSLWRFWMILDILMW
jgi:hypothetical protein